MALGKSKINKWYIIGGLLVLATVGLIAAKKMGVIGKEPEIEAEFTKVGRGNITETVSASGKIQPEVEVKISPDVSGEIIGLYVNEGDSVTKGQLLMKIRPDNYESFVDRGRANVNQSKAGTEQAKAALLQQETNLIRAKQELDRVQRLYDQKVSSTSELEVAQTNYTIAKQQIEAAKANINASIYAEKSAEAALKDASDNLRKTTIFAPQSGIISKLGVELGERVVGTSQMSGTELLRIANLSNMEVRINVNENDIVRVNVGDTAIIDVDAFVSTGKKFKGVVYEIASTANGSGGATAALATSTDAVTEFEVKIRILKSSYKELQNTGLATKYPFKPGMTATVDVLTETKRGVLTVPIAAVTTRSNPEGKAEETKKDDDNDEPKVTTDTKTKKEEPKEVVFVNNKGVVEMKEVKTGITDTNTGNIELISGLKEGEEIVSGPYNLVSKKLKNKDKVVPKKKEEEKKK